MAKKKRKKNKSEFPWGPVIFGGGALLLGLTLASSASGSSDLGSLLNEVDFDFGGDDGTFTFQEVQQPPAPTHDPNTGVIDQSKTGKALVSAARRLIGTPYGPSIGGPTRAGMENYLDCSGTIYQAAKMTGVKIPRNATGQYLRAMGYRMVDENTARNTAGALIFFHKPNTEGSSAFHVEMSTGDGTVIHNMNPKTSVKESPWGWWYGWVKRKGYTVSYGVLPDFAV